MTGDLFEHVLEKGNSRIKIRLATAIEIDGNTDLGFQGIAADAYTSI
jgi:hypothetical protein